MLEKQEQISVVLPNHLGDLVMATPALRALRAGRRGARIRGVVRSELVPVLRGLSSLDEVMGHGVYARGASGLARRPSPARRMARRLSLARRLADSDSVVLFPNSFSSALLARATGAAERVGYARSGRGWLLSRALRAPRENGRFAPVAMERYYLDLVRELGCPDTGTRLELATEPDAEAACDRSFERAGFDASRPLVCVAPGAGFGPSKLWPTRYYATLARALLDDGAQVALVHAAGEEPLADEIKRGAGPGLVDLGGASMSLSLLKSVVKRARLMVCNDAGARHIAAAFGVPCLVLMGPTSIRYTNLNLEKTRLLREPVECSPCQRKVCPIDHRCMTRLLPERVIDEARAALHAEGWRGHVELEYAP